MKQLLPLLLLLSCTYLAAQNTLIGFSESGELQAPNSGGMIWEMNADGTGFTVLKNFHTQKPVRPVGKMRVGPDGKGYGLAQGYDLDAGNQVLYQYDFSNKSLSILALFKDSLWSSSMLFGADGMLYGCRHLSGNTQALCRISPDGATPEVLHTFETEGYVSDLLQMPDGRFVLVCEEYAEWHQILSGYPDGSEWKTLVDFGPDVLGNYCSNLVAGSDGYLYGVVWQYFGIIKFFKMLPDGQNYSVFYETQVPDFGNQISLNLGANDQLYALVQKDSKQVLYQVPVDGTAPVSIFEDGAHGYLRSVLSRDNQDNLYYHTSRLNGESQIAYIFKVKSGSTQVQVINNLYFDSSQDGLLPLLAHPDNERLYFWKHNETDQESTLMSCKNTGASLFSEYTFDRGIADLGACPKHLIKGSDGKYYGLLSKGGLNGKGFIFSMNPDGSDFKILGQMLAPQAPISWWPEEVLSCLFEGSDGMIYGTVGDGNVFRVNKDGSGFAVIYTNFHRRSNFVEGADGKLYWGGLDLMRMEKDGSNPTVVKSNFCSRFTSYDFCEIFKLNNGNFAGVGSFTEEGNCLDEYTYPFYFTFDPNINYLYKENNSSIQSAITTLGKDGNLYLGKGKIDPEAKTVTYYAVGCDYLSGWSNQYQITNAAFQGKNHQIFGTRATYYTSPDGRWLPMSWSATNGECTMSADWQPEMGFHGQLAFEKTIASTPTTQAIIQEGITLTPNPTHASAQISAHLVAATQTTLTVSDMLGRIVYSEKTKAEAGENVFEIPATALKSPGVYQVVLKTEQGTWSRLLSVH